VAHPADTAAAAAAARGAAAAHAVAVTGDAAATGAAASVHRGQLLSFVADPRDGTDAASYTHFVDGAMLVENGRIAALGPADAILATLPSDFPVVDHGRNLLLPGFIDNHIHYAQSDVIGAGGRQLLDWLNDYTFVEERRFGDARHALEVANFFFDELARNGTTTALVFCTVHPESVDAFFGAAARRRLRMIAGKVLMDRTVRTVSTMRSRRASRSPPPPHSCRWRRGSRGIFRMRSFTVTWRRITPRYAG
jgi:cytosine/adenosine deaminase-related metal-dependent hydrolase